MSVEVIQGSILDFAGDCIVNPANSFLRHGAGLARAIADAAAPKPQTAYENAQRDAAISKAWWTEQYNHPLIPTGAVAVTSAGHLPYKGIVHAVGPIWSGGQLCEQSLLHAVHANACAAAYERGWRSIAFPAISCGIFGYPIERAAPVAVNAVAGFWAEPQPEGVEMEIAFYLFEDAHFAAYEAALCDASHTTAPLHRPRNRYTCSYHPFDLLGRP